MNKKCFVCEEKEVIKRDPSRMGNPALSQVRHYKCQNCGASYTVRPPKGEDFTRGLVF